MAFPPHVAEAIAEHDISLPGKTMFATEHDCEGAQFHSPKPLVLVSVAIGDRTAWLCPTCAHNLVVLQRLLKATGGNLPWVVRREFGNRLRALAVSSWNGKRRGA